jgi:apolipoprotein N-acyltransferase
LLLFAEHCNGSNILTLYAKDGAKLVLWSEETSQIFNSTDKQQFLDQASAIASNNTIYLAVSYINNIPDTIENLMTLFAPNGTILLTYSKAHPVVGVEDQPPGPNVLQYVDTPDLGRVGVGICFDYNFPSLIDQAGQNKVDLMLQASWTWGPLGTFHARGNSLRAIENGFTMLRCGSQGMSGVFTHTSDSPYQQQFATLSNQTLIFQVPRLSYVRTTYTVFRGAFGWICLALGLVILIYLIVSPILHKTMRSRSAAV